MADEFTIESLHRAIDALNIIDIEPYPRYAISGGVLVRIRSPGQPPEFENDAGEWDILEPAMLHDGYLVDKNGRRC